MYFVSYLYNEIESYGILNEDKIEIYPMKSLLSKIDKKESGSLREFIELYSNDLIEDLHNLPKENINTIPLDEVKLISPIPYTRRNIFCLGKNYAEHINEVRGISEEMVELPKYPIYFTKIADPAIGHEDKIIVPKDLDLKLDYEVELAIIMGRDGKDIPIEDAKDYIFGYSVANDITSRNHQRRHTQWFKGKSMDNFSAIGPFIVHKDSIDFPPKLKIMSKVNNEVRQNSYTDEMIFDIPHIISDLSKGLTLRAGDIILTGTPAGVGMGFNPPRFLNDGDIVECYIEDIGTLINTIEYK